MEKVIGKIIDPKFVEQWNIRLLRVPEAWAYGQGKGVVVGIIDTGVDASHKDLGWSSILNIRAMDSDAVVRKKYLPVMGAITAEVHAKVLPGFNYLTDDDWTWDRNRHGTYIAGTVGAEIDDFGMVGVAPLCKIRPYVVLDPNGRMVKWAFVEEAIYQAIADGCDVINMSLAWWGQYDGIEEAVKDAREAGVIVCAATGNSNRDRIAYPARYSPDLIAVGGCNTIGQRWIETKRKGSNYGAGVDCVAPASPQVVTKKLRSRFSKVDATSMACAHMSGVAALMKGIDPEINTTKFRRLIQAHSSRGAWDAHIGYGVPDVQRMAKELSGVAKPPQTRDECLRELYETASHIMKTADKIERGWVV